MRWPSYSRFRDHSLGAFCGLARRFSLVVLLAALTGPGCNTLRRMSGGAPAGAGFGSGRLTVPDGPTVTQNGSVAAGAQVATSTTRSTVPIPAGSIIELPSPAGAQNARPNAQISPPAHRVTLAAPSTLTAETTTQTATGPTTHAPPAPPSPAELATGAGIRVFYWLAAGLALACVALFYSGHAKAALVAGIGAGGLPLLASSALWLASHAAVAVVAISGALVAAWFFVRNRIAPPAPPPSP